MAVEVSVASLRVERRLKARYPLRLSARYRSLDQKQKVTGVGITVNISSSSLLLTSQHKIQVGTPVEVMIDWPSLLGSSVRLQLATMGRVIRSGPSTFVIGFAQYQFRTMRSRPLPVPLTLQQSA
jgi:PilZ domain